MSSPISTKVPRVVVLGDVMTDIVVRLAAQVATFSDTPAKISLSPGGSATNEAVWLARGGIAVDLVAVVGEDQLGRDAVRELRKEGIVAHVTSLKGRTSGVVISMVDADGRRSMLTDRGANLDLGAARIEEGLFRPGDHLHVSGYELFDEESRLPALELIRQADEVGMTKSIDPCSSGPLSLAGADAFLSWTKGFDVCCANLDEGRTLAGADEPEEVALSLTKHYQTVALTLGDRGALAATRGGAALMLPPLPATVVDTTGAGDAFCGSFLAAWLHGRPASEALRAGLEASAVAVATVGARPAR